MLYTKAGVLLCVAMRRRILCGGACVVAVSLLREVSLVMPVRQPHTLTLKPRTIVWGSLLGGHPRV